MLKAPKFWYKKNDTYLSNTLYPLSLLFRFGTKIRNIFSQKKISKIPVICIGNIVVGGAGKTPVAIKLGSLLKKNGYKPHFVSKGYGGIETNNTLIKACKVGEIYAQFGEYAIVNDCEDCDDMEVKNLLKY